MDSLREYYGQGRSLPLAPLYQWIVVCVVEETAARGGCDALWELGQGQGLHVAT